MVCDVFLYMYVWYGSLCGVMYNICIYVYVCYVYVHACTKAYTMKSEVSNLLVLEKEQNSGSLSK